MLLFWFLIVLPVALALFVLTLRKIQELARRLLCDRRAALERTGGAQQHTEMTRRTQQRHTALAVGTRVEAQWNGCRAWYKGKVAKANSDGTYAILYDDGDLERSVKREQIRVSTAEDAPIAAQKDVETL